VVLDFAILTKKSSAGRIQRTSAGLVERRTIRDATKPLSFVTQFHFAVRVEPKTAQHAVENFSILAKLLNEHASRLRAPLKL
jgi:hypothetical protein